MIGAVLITWLSWKRDDTNFRSRQDDFLVAFFTVCHRLCSWANFLIVRLSPKRTAVSVFQLDLLKSPVLTMLLNLITILSRSWLYSIVSAHLALGALYSTIKIVFVVVMSNECRADIIWIVYCVNKCNKAVREKFVDQYHHATSGLCWPITKIRNITFNFIWIEFLSHQWAMSRWCRL